jgi:serine protease Do
MNRLLRSQLWLAASLMLVVGVIVGAGAMQAGHAPAAAVSAAASPVREAPAMPSTFAPVVKSVLPAVVNISTSKMVSPPASAGGDPLGELFGGRRGVPQQQQPQRQVAEGSGVIISPDGYIMTNNHVVEGSKDVKVVLADKREMNATVIGADAKTDVALLKIDAKDLPFVKMGSSAGVEVGDVALAIGNPFGLGQTVTMGIISAIGRAPGIEDYEDFIQTDASINPGNSGGALIDMKGELIGINTAILSPTGGNQGIGFAVPIDMARQVMTQLKEHGAVTRAYIGVSVKEVSAELASQLRIKSAEGAVIAEVVPNGPADKAGLHKDDVIVSVNGKAVDQRSLRLTTAMLMPGAKVDLGVIHAGTERNVALNLGTMPADPPQTADEDGPFRQP